MASNEIQTADDLKALILSCGARNAAVVGNDQIVLSTDFREICKGNACGNYGQCYMCPPDVGEIDDLMARLRTFQTGILYQAVYSLEDSYDFEGMQAAGAAFNRTSQVIHDKVLEGFNLPFLHLAAGGCRICEVCAKRDGQPCREPDKALPSLEAYGVDVYRTATNAGLKYINGQDTVTYFGMLLV
ncbi:MAG TPA: DUF2284 domain-containing protein [Candidatus Limiplasma sp.]|nr:DUF2284 domain-containing protein [Candidatus Limiplasma sp.]